MSKFKSNPVRINIQIEPEIRNKYHKYCIDKNINLSDRIRQLIELDLKGNIQQ